MQGKPAHNERTVSTYCYQCVAGPDLLKVRVEDGIATEVTPNFDAATVHPAGGKACVKAFGLVQKAYNPHRILYPMKRTRIRRRVVTRTQASCAFPGRRHYLWSPTSLIPCGPRADRRNRLSACRCELWRRWHTYGLYGNAARVLGGMGPDRHELWLWPRREMLSLRAPLWRALAQGLHGFTGYAAL